MSCTSLKEVIAFAVKEEKKAAKLYLGLSKKVKDKGAREMLLEMAGMEKGHQKKLESLKPGKTPDNSKAKIQDLKIAETLVEKPLNKEAGPQTVILFAIQSEKKAHEMYNGLARFFTEAGARKLMTGLAAEELQHKNMLEKAYDDNIFREN